jgi:hypothetical protein
MKYGNVQRSSLVPAKTLLLSSPCLLRFNTGDVACSLDIKFEKQLSTFSKVAVSGPVGEAGKIAPRL